MNQPDREQIRRDAETFTRATPPAWTDDNTLLLARHILALLAELEQAEQQTLNFSRKLETAEHQRDQITKIASRRRHELADLSQRLGTP